jgi:hypothetical protein
MVRQQEQQITCSNTNNTAADNSGRHDPAVAAIISMAAKETMTAINGTAKVEKFYTGSDDRNNSNNVSSYHPPPDLCWQKKQRGHDPAIAATESIAAKETMTATNWKAERFTPKVMTGTTATTAAAIIHHQIHAGKGSSTDTSSNNSGRHDPERK